MPAEGLGYLTLWAENEPQPSVSTLNADDGAIASNMAIVPTANLSIDAFASNPTQLILDINGYFGSYPYTLTVTNSGAGVGAITSSDGKINCGTTCTATYPAGSYVLLTGVLPSGVVWGGWTGAACSFEGGSQTQCGITMNSNLSETGTFNCNGPCAMTWSFDNTCEAPLYYRLFEFAAGASDPFWEWPNSTTVYSLPLVGYGNSETIACTPGNRVCYGASSSLTSDANGYWGVGINGTESSCVTTGQCCASCAGPFTQQETLSCPAN